ncbi:hypothetical protein [Lunatibacter salilacus]|uniref:hypothetical protein n=1 Tax=Lunatibacter salilacus TaxID=2483804 RepID=UPI00131B12DF|nr:hypothetical protein [Lunatibacter salilacus]
MIHQLINMSPSKNKTEVTKESIRLRKGLTYFGIQYAHWKSNCRLIDSLNGQTDLDLLIHPICKEAFANCMKELGCKRLRSPSWGTYQDVEDWICLDEETGIFLHLHIHFSLVTGIKHVKHLRLPWTEIFFDHLTIDSRSGWPIPIPELEVIILIIRIYAKMPPLERVKRVKNIPDHMNKELQSLLQASEVTKIKAICEKLNLIIPYNFEKMVDDIVHDPNHNAIEKIARHFYNQLGGFYQKDWYLSVSQSLIYRVKIKLMGKLNPWVGPFSFKKRVVSGGRIFAFVGSDGSGKSTLSNEILNWLSYKIDTQYFYFGKEPFIKCGRRHMFFLDNFIYKEGFVGNILRRSLGSSFFVLRSKKKANMLKLASNLKKKGSVIVCDRLPQLQVPGINDGTMLHDGKNSLMSRWEKNQFEKIQTYNIDVVFKLNVSPQVAISRKPGHDQDTIRKKCQLISMVNFPNAKMIDIDADRPFPEVLLDVQQIIWKHL